MLSANDSTCMPPSLPTGPAAAGETWSHPAKLIVTEKPNVANKYWTWVHWELPVETSQFFTATEVVCRAWDESQNTQPAVLTWTLLGQGNNSMFRLRLHKEVDPQVRPLPPAVPPPSPTSSSACSRACMHPHARAHATPLTVHLCAEGVVHWRVTLPLSHLHTSHPACSRRAVITHHPYRLTAPRGAQVPSLRWPFAWTTRGGVWGLHYRPWYQQAGQPVPYD